MNYQECVKKLAESTQFLAKDGLSVRVKPVPDDDRDGVADSRVLAMLKSCPEGFSPKDPDHMSMEEIMEIRRHMGCENIDLSQDVSREKRVIQTPSGEVGIYLYTPKKAGTKPGIVYIHGGGFLGGTTRVVENACKLQAERSEAVVISVDYCLAPENPFPKGLEQCWQTVCWVKEHAAEFDVDENKLVIMGDSAGACLATACCMLDQEKLIKLQILLYPCLINTPESDFPWSINEYEITEEKELLTNVVMDVGEAKKQIFSSYARNREELKNPLASPFLAKNYHDMPTTIIATAEYDYLRLEGEEYARRLSEDGVDVILYRYKGINHSFYERTGEFPQAEDFTNECAQAIKDL